MFANARRINDNKIIYSSTKEEKTSNNVSLPINTRNIRLISTYQTRIV